jgi:hypothetical protein
MDSPIASAAPQEGSHPAFIEAEEQSVVEYLSAPRYNRAQAQVSKATSDHPPGPSSGRRWGPSS